MCYKTSVSLRVQLIDHDGSNVSSAVLIQKLDGLACCSDSVLNYAELPFAIDVDLRGGQPRLKKDEKGSLVITVEVDSLRKLVPKELKALREDFEGQLTDGIGSGCFDELTTATGFGITPTVPLKLSCAQMEGTAWQPKPATKKGNGQRIAAAAKIASEMDNAPAKSPKLVKGSGAAKKQGAPKAGSSKRPNLSKLLRLLAKPERNQLVDQIKAELEACGNDLSSVRDGEYPHGNLSDPKLLRLLLEAKLPPETTDVKGHSLLIQAAVEPRSIAMLLKYGVDVNRVCPTYDATALMRAARLGKLKSVELLLEHGADPSIKNTAGKSARDLVDRYSRQRQSMIDLL